MPAARIWQVTEQGSGAVRLDDDGCELSLPAASGNAYHNAQISDYVVRGDFDNQPPLRLSLKARAQGKLVGTAGFGFWNHSFAPGLRSFRLPQAIWFFFAGPRSDMALARGVAGQGWKAAAINARSWRFLALLPAAPLGFLLMRNRMLYDSLWHLGQRAIGVNEALLAPQLLQDWHSYSIEWRRDDALLSLDGRVVLRAAHTPRGKLGFIAWVDNQYAVATPQGNFGWGLLDISRAHSLQLRNIQITSPA